jgi:pimeloyl-ACP methyl ester carboxylesterase
MNRRQFLTRSAGFLALTGAVPAAIGQSSQEKIDMPRTSIHRIEADGITVFYREAGPPDAPVVLLLHGFPTSSFQYRELIPRLADQYRVIAPDLPGFGFTDVPENRHYKYSFDALAHTMLAFIDVLALKNHALYVFDYGAPTGFRLAMARPERVRAIVSQNGNAYEEGLGDAWAPIQRYWREPSSENRETVRKALSPEGLRWQYTAGVPNPFRSISAKRSHRCLQFGASMIRSLFPQGQKPSGGTIQTRPSNFWIQRRRYAKDHPMLVVQ